MSLQFISHAGIQAYCSDLITDKDNRIYLLITAGYQTAVRGIIANVLENRSVHIFRNNQEVYLKRTPDNFLIRYMKLPSGLYQGMLISVIAKPGRNQSHKGFLIVGEDLPSVKKLFFRHLDEKTGVPLHTDWTEWLWNTFVEKEWLSPLETMIGKLTGFLAAVVEDEFKDVITEAIAYQIPEIMRGFERGGETDNAGKQPERFS